MNTIRHSIWVYGMDWSMVAQLRSHPAQWSNVGNKLLVNFQESFSLFNISIFMLIFFLNAFTRLAFHSTKTNQFFYRSVFLFQKFFFLKARRKETFHLFLTLILRIDIINKKDIIAGTTYFFYDTKLYLSSQLLRRFVWLGYREPNFIIKK